MPTPLSLKRQRAVRQEFEDGSQTIESDETKGAIIAEYARFEVDAGYEEGVFVH